MRVAARNRLREPFDASDCPVSLIGLFAIEHDFPSVEPPSYLRQLSPEQYEPECRRMQSRFDEAVQLAKAAFIEELAKLVEHLGERVSGLSDGNRLRKPWRLPTRFVVREWSVGDGRAHVVASR